PLSCPPFSPGRYTRLRTAHLDDFTLVWPCGLLDVGSTEPAADELDRSRLPGGSCPAHLDGVRCGIRVLSRGSPSTALPLIAAESGEHTYARAERCSPTIVISSRCECWANVSFSTCCTRSQSVAPFGQRASKSATSDAAPGDAAN